MRVLVFSNLHLFSLYIRYFAKFKTMPATLHALFVHGHEYLTWAEHTVGIPLGAISEGAIEAYNKMVKALRRMHARMSSIQAQSADIIHYELWWSDPLVNAFLEVMQEKRRGFIRRSKRNRAM